MDGIRQYLISVVAAAMLCAVAKNLIHSKGTVGTALKMTAGLLMLLAVLKPWTSISLDSLIHWTENITADGSNYVASGKMMADETYRQSIIEQTQAYILDEAKAMDCDLTVEVMLSSDDIPVPAQVRLSGEASPYARQKLANMMEQTLGISREDQIWT